MELNWNPEQLGKGKIVVKIDKRMNGSYILEKKGKVLGFNMIVSQNDKEFYSAYNVYGNQEIIIPGKCIRGSLQRSLCLGQQY